MNANNNQTFGTETHKNLGAVQGKRGRGRPPGSKNKPKGFVEDQREGWFAGPSGKAPAMLQKKWQREYIKPQFVLSRQDTLDLFLRYLKSTEGKVALSDILNEGFPGLSRMNDSSLAKYLEKTSLLSRYPHDVIIKG
jgi:hypothetical protein